MEDISAWDLPESTELEIIEKIKALTRQIRGDWTDPRSECRRIIELCNKLTELINKINN